jgi:hypothetical protein
MIAESLQDNLPLFNKLQTVRVQNLTKRVGKRIELPDDGIVGDYLTDGEEVYFKVDSNNFWLKVKFKMFVTPSKQSSVEGRIELRIDKEEKMINLKKKLQIMMIKLWSMNDCRKADTYYLIDKFEVSSLMPPNDESLLESSANLSMQPNLGESQKNDRTLLQ